MTDPYIPRIRSGEIKPPQYMDNKVSGPNPSIDDWIKSVESQGEISKIDGAIKWKRTQKEFKIKKLDQHGKPVKGVVFSAYDTRADAENNKNPIGNATSDVNGDVKFTGLPLYYGFYVKETSVPDGFAISKEIIPIYRDNGVRFIGEKKASDFKVPEAKEGQDLNKYLQSLMRSRDPQDFTDQIDWLVFNDNGIEKLVPKKSLKYGVSWNQINNEGLMYGNKTVIVDGKTYKIRLMRAYNDTVDVNQGGFDSSSSDSDGKYEKGSEWNRMILPLIGVSGKEKDPIRGYYDYVTNSYGRFGATTVRYVEQNMPIIASYTWWKDFRGGYHGHSRLMQNRSRFDSSFRAFRGQESSFEAAAYSYHSRPTDFGDRDLGWLPVLEMLDQNASSTPPVPIESRRVDTGLSYRDSEKTGLTKQESKKEKGIIEIMKEKIGEVFRRD